MGKRIQAKTGKAQSLMGFFVGLLFCVAGLLIVIPQFGLFGIIWTLIAAGITIINGINAFSVKGIATHRIEIEDDDITVRANADRAAIDSRHAEERLIQLNGLFDSGLVTREEYDQKKKEILADL